MATGDTWPCECKEIEDPASGVTLRQLTDYKGHSHHVYFTNPGWYAGGRKMLVGCDRDNRTNLFAIDLDTCEAWPIRPREGGEAVGHEYWLADGETIAYHGRWPDGRKLFGRIRYDNADRLEVAFPHDTGHMHSNAFDLLVGDGPPYIRLWRWNGEGFDGPRILAEHRSSMHIQKAHPHPRFDPEGRHVVFTSDRSGYCNVYQAAVPDFESLPAIEDKA